jgi:hypothetical protein
MADLVMLAQVNHQPFFDKNQQEIPLNVLKTIFHSPDDDRESIKALHERVKNQREIYISTNKELPIKRKDQVVIEAKYNKEGYKYEAIILHLIEKKVDARYNIIASFYLHSIIYNWTPATPEDFKMLSVNEPYTLK